MDNRKIGTDGPEIYPIGIGAMSWSGSKMWGYGNVVDVDGAALAFDAAAGAGVTFFDTAEIYGRGTSERVLGEILLGRQRKDYVIATKYAPLPWRNHRKAVAKALDKSLANLQLDSVDLYQVHFPSKDVTPVIEAMAETVESGKVIHVGVSNYSADQMRRAADVLQKHGMKLASNQVEYSLIKRSPEVDGVLDACSELGASLIAYSPLGRGFLSGKYTASNPPKDWRKFSSVFGKDKAQRAEPLLSALGEVAETYGKTIAQVALNWLARDERVIPIPGGRTADHARANAEACTFTLSEEEASLIDRRSEPFSEAVSFGFRS